MPTSNTLNQLNGSQVQATSVQGISVAKDYVTINVDWVDQATNQYFDPTTYSVSILKDGSSFSDLNVMKPLSRLDDTRGVWTFGFLMQKSDGTALDPGTYQFTFTGSAIGITPVTHVLTFAGATIPVAQYFINALRLRLGDKRAKRYLVDDNTRQRWTDEELYSYLDDARIDIGQTPPSPAEFPFNYFYAEGHGILLLGGFINALMARGIFETYNKINYNDELTFNVDRSNFFQNAQSLLQQYLNAKLTWKRDYSFHALAGGIGMASGKFPLYFSRIMSLQTTMQNMFYG